MNTSPMRSYHKQDVVPFRSLAVQDKLTIIEMNYQAALGRLSPYRANRLDLEGHAQERAKLKARRDMLIEKALGEDHAAPFFG